MLSPRSRSQRTSTSASRPPSPTTFRPGSQPHARARAIRRRRGPARDPTPRGAVRGRGDVDTSSLPKLGEAPDFIGNDRWFNSTPLTLAGLRGRVVLVDFWTYTCINCIRTFPRLRRGQGLPARRADDRRRPLARVRVRAQGLERQTAISQNESLPGRAGPRDGDLERLEQPVLAGQIPDRRRGHVRYAHFGEGDDEETEAAIRALLARRGARSSALTAARSHLRPVPGDARDLPRRRPRRALPPRFSARGQRLHAVRGRVAREPLLARRDLEGRRRVATAGTAETSPRALTGKDVYLVLSGPGTVDVEVDGRREKTVRVTTQSIYHLVSRPKVGTHSLRLRLLPRRRRLRLHLRLHAPSRAVRSCCDNH